jgi:two-component system nitrate/nitrite response regulator NarL
MTMFGRELRLVVIADNPLTRAGLVAILEGQPACSIVGQVDSSRLDQLELYQPDVLVWDLDWGQQFQETAYPAAVLVPDEAYATSTRSAGARGIFSRQINPLALVAALQAISQGLFVTEPILAGSLFPNQDQPTTSEEPLTPRELEVLQLLAEGISNKAIAYQLGISEHTVKFHVNAIMTKLNAQSRTEAAVRAARLGLIAL